MESDDYAPDEEIDAEAWLALDEGERIARVRAAHARGKWTVGQNADLHACVHVAVETRLAQGDEAVNEAYVRLRATLDRHTTIHALASVALNQILDAYHGKPFDPSWDGAFAEIDPDDWKQAPAPPRNTHVARPYKGRRGKR